ncbi:MAG: aa3-type cytochrome c oxidase subunit IV [Asticcacaulis sp.]
MADHNSDHIKGEMDIHEQVASYALFCNITKWGSLIVAVALLFFTIWFAVSGAGFLPAIITAIVVSIIGFFMLKKKPDAH